MNLKEVLRHKAINGWPLFYLISVPISAMIFFKMMGTDLSHAQGVSSMIAYSVRWAVPFIFIVVAASSFKTLFPSPFAAWWLRNRKFLGLCFAVALAWQGLFISIISTIHREYYFDQISFRDELEGTIGYVFLVAMVVTSFHFGRKHLDPIQWKLIHKGGVYFLWAYAFSVYWWNLFYYPTVEPYEPPRTIDYVFYWCGFIVFALRILAWGKQRKDRALKEYGLAGAPVLNRLLGSVFVAIGLVGAATGDKWRESAETLIAGSTGTEEFILWLPFWPLEPFLPLLIIGFGTMLITTVKTQMQPSLKHEKT